MSKKYQDSELHRIWLSLTGEQRYALLLVLEAFSSRQKESEDSERLTQKRRNRPKSQSGI